MMTFLFIILLLFCLVALLAEDFPGLFKNRKNHRYYSRKESNKYNYQYNQKDLDNVYCPECGSPNVTVYRDGSCECQDCEFQFHVDYL